MQKSLIFLALFFILGFFLSGITGVFKRSIAHTPIQGHRFRRRRGGGGTLPTGLLGLPALPICFVYCCPGVAANRARVIVVLAEYPLVLVRHSTCA